jgi:hypothetical protein
MADLGVAWTILSLESVGSGVVAWLAVTPCAKGVHGHGAEHPLRIEETGDVPILRVLHDGGVPILLPSDVVLAGGKQTRVVERSVILAPRSTTDVPVRCVERGRWSSRPGPSSGQFEAKDMVGLEMRRDLNKMKSENHARTGVYQADQQGVWDRVDRELTASRVMSTTASYEACLDSPERKKRARTSKRRARPAPGANGVLVIDASSAVWLEVYPSESALVAAASMLLSDLFDAGLAPVQTDRAAVESILEQMARSPTRRVPPVPGTLGDARVLVGAASTGSCLFMDGALAHLAVGDVVRA